MSMTLEYNYAVIDTTTGLCGGCITSSYKVDHPAYIEVPVHTNDYMGKYYKEGFWYEDSEFQILADGLN